MNVRSLRTRLVLATALIIIALAVVMGVFSSFTMKWQFERFLTEQRHDEGAIAQQILDSTPAREEALRRIEVQLQRRSVLLDAQNRVIAMHPPQMRTYTISRQGGELQLARIVNGQFEALRVRGPGLQLPGGERLFLFPPDKTTQGPRRFRIAVDRWLIAGLGVTAVLASLVMLMIFRRVFRPVDALTAGARALAGGRLDTRVDVRGDDEIAELGRAFNSMAEALERNERARRNMVSDVAHELRTPLTSIRVQIEAVQDGVVDADAKFLASLEEDAATLSRLVDDLQQLSLAEAGQLRLERADFVVADLLDRARSGLETRGLAIASDVDDALVVHADARRIVQVLRNLLVNAIAYAQSSITVTARAVGDRVEIRVADDGPGVPDEHAARIFDRFYRADASRSRATGGAGLGLAIAKQLVELHGGTIRYERPAFIVTL